MEALREIALAYRLPYLNLENYRPDKHSVSLIAHELAQRLQVLPLFRERERLALAVVHPQDLAAQDYVGRLTGLEIEPVLVDERALQGALQQYYVADGQSGVAWGRLAAQALDRSRPETKHRLSEASDSPVARLFEELIAQAVQLRASDLHLEVAQGQPRLRYRIDGVLNDFDPPPGDVYPALISRIKILARLDIAEKRRPQDGRITMQVGGQSLELRVSIIPYLDGEGTVVRVLGAGGGVLSLSEVGFDSEMLQRYRQLVRRTNGLFLVTGPTGAGKTTTLYASLADIVSPKLKIVTLEDPVEYRISGVCQIPMRPEIDFSFVDGLRSVLRHDPDVLMVGEIRDLESAEIAIRASLTGHLIFATLHTNTAAQAITRLVDIGVAPYKLMTSLIWVLAQRLVRRLCPGCSLPVQDTAAPRFQAVGCEACGGIGYLGRVPVYEYLEIDDEMRALEFDELLATRILKLARARGFVSAKDRALALVGQGLTTPEEIQGILLES